MGLLGEEGKIQVLVVRRKGRVFKNIWTDVDRGTEEAVVFRLCSSKGAGQHHLHKVVIKKIGAKGS